ncbi:hypothetical protein TSAR_011295 [Trichomalopsis sarcophagae]|uniref:Uncharacterized protein n=1 Tax=Trichomalopsis sarcophagae TaxID=543379 RepID=A0A232F0G2_9HYME|nr:hypothetical protein TSAR_011295 [Trichomalopsis sarcophagae]
MYSRLSLLVAALNVSENIRRGASRRTCKYDDRRGETFPSASAAMLHILELMLINNSATLSRTSFVIRDIICSLRDIRLWYKVEYGISVMYIGMRVYSYDLRQLARFKLNVFAVAL